VSDNETLFGMKEPAKNRQVRKAITIGGVMCNFRIAWLVSTIIVFITGYTAAAAAVTLPELASRVETMGRAEREALLVKGAKEEKEVMFYGTTPVNQLAVLKKAFSARYPFVELKHFYSPRQGILNKTLSEARAGANIVDVIMTDLSYGSLFIKEGISHPYSTPDVKRYVRGSYDPNGQWYTMYMLSIALVYNRNMVKPNEAPRSYQDLLDPKWKGSMLFDPEAAYIMAAMEQAWGKEKARDYLERLAKQNLIFRRGTTLTTQLIAAGEQPIAIAVNAETAAEVRDKGAPLGFSVLSPRIIKPNGFFVAKKAPHPHAALLFTDWTLSEEGQKVLALELGKGVAMTGIPVKYKEFQGEPDYVVGPEFGNQLKQHMTEFQKIFGL
jgi:iron(III) transport system substrate-binding protein